MDYVDYVVVVNRNWRPATRSLSFGAKGLLVTLLEMAAFTGRRNRRGDRRHRSASRQRPWA